MLKRIQNIPKYYEHTLHSKHFPPIYINSSHWLAYSALSQRNEFLAPAFTNNDENDDDCKAISFCGQQNLWDWTIFLALCKLFLWDVHNFTEVYSLILDSYAGISRCIEKINYSSGFPKGNAAFVCYYTPTATLIFYLMYANLLPIGIFTIILRPSYRKLLSAPKQLSRNAPLLSTPLFPLCVLKGNFNPYILISVMLLL
jgi:hypothetical protein